MVRTILKKLVLLSMINSVLSSSCSTSDYAAVVGGYGHTVSDVQIAVDSDENLLVGGLMTKSLGTSYTASFFYLLLTNGNCDVPWRHEWTEFDLATGAVAFNSAETAAYMLAYTSSVEYMVVMRDPYLSIVNNDGIPTVFAVQSVSSTDYQQLYHAALIPMPNGY